MYLSSKSKINDEKENRELFKKQKLDDFFNRFSAKLAGYNQMNQSEPTKNLWPSNSPSLSLAASSSGRSFTKPFHELVTAINQAEHEFSKASCLARTIEHTLRQTSPISTSSHKKDINKAELALTQDRSLCETSVDEESCVNIDAMHSNMKMDVDSSSIHNQQSRSEHNLKKSQPRKLSKPTVRRVRTIGLPKSSSKLESHLSPDNTKETDTNNSSLSKIISKVQSKSKSANINWDSFLNFTKAGSELLATGKIESFRARIVDELQHMQRVQLWQQQNALRLGKLLAEIRKAFTVITALSSNSTVLKQCLGLDIFKFFTDRCTMEDSNLKIQEQNRLLGMEIELGLGLKTESDLNYLKIAGKLDPRGIFALNAQAEYERIINDEKHIGLRDIISFRYYFQRQSPCKLPFNFEDMLELKSSISSCQSEWGVFDEKRDSNVAYLFDHVVFNPELLDFYVRGSRTQREEFVRVMAENLYLFNRKMAELMKLKSFGQLKSDIFRILEERANLSEASLTQLSVTTSTTDANSADPSSLSSYNFRSRGHNSMPPAPSDSSTSRCNGLSSSSSCDNEDISSSSQPCNKCFYFQADDVVVRVDGIEGDDFKALMPRIKSINEVKNNQRSYHLINMKSIANAHKSAHQDDDTNVEASILKSVHTAHAFREIYRRVQMNDLQTFPVELTLNECLKKPSKNISYARPGVNKPERSHLSDGKSPFLHKSL